MRWLDLGQKLGITFTVAGGSSTASSIYFLQALRQKSMLLGNVYPVLSMGLFDYVLLWVTYSWLHRAKASGRILDPS